MFNLATYTQIHVVFSLIGIASGIVVVLGLIAGKRLNLSNALFLGTTAATSITGYGFPFDHLLPSHIVGAISLIVLAVAIYARYVRHLAGGWRVAYVVSAVAALYFNCFVLVVQAFLKVPRPERARPDPVRAALRRRPARGARAVHRAGRRGSQALQGAEVVRAFC